MANTAVTFAGTTIGISAGVPATYNEAGFDALSYTNIGEITTAPGSGGKKFTDVAYSTLDDRATKHLKGTSDQAEQSIAVIDDLTDAGQTLADAALDSDNEYAFKITYNNGDVAYFQALVTGYEGDGGDSNAIRQSTITFRRSYQGTVKVAGPGTTSFTLTYTAGANGSLIGSSPQTVSIGTNGTPVAAVANTGYDFDDWSDGITTNPRQDIYVQGNVTVTANFVAE